MQLVDSAEIPLSATSYANDVKAGIQTFLGQNADVLNQNIGESNAVRDLQVDRTAGIFVMR